MNRRRFLAAGTSWVAASGAVDGAQPPEALSGSTFRHGAQEYVLADVIPPDARGAPAWETPFAFEAKRALMAWLSAGDWRFETDSRDRWGRTVGKALRGERSAQAALLDAGAVRVRPTGADHAFIEGLLLAEQRARSHRRGLWAHPAYAVQDANIGDIAPGRYTLAAGIPTRIDRRRSRMFVDFGEDFRTDFTISLDERNLKRWPAVADAIAEAGKQAILVRGWVEWRNGPTIELAHPKQLTIRP